jgi:hypothetical protein
MADPLLDLLGVQAPEQQPDAQAQDPLLATLGIQAAPVEGTTQKTAQTPVAPAKIDDSFLGRLGQAYQGLKTNATQIPYIGGVLRGAMDLPEGITQLAAHGLNSVGLVSDKDLGDYENLRKQAQDAYTSNRQHQVASVPGAPAAQPGFDYGRLGGNVLATLPAAGIGAIPEGLMARVGLGGVMGAGMGVLSPTDADQNGQSFAANKQKEMLLGGALGAGLPALGGAIASGISTAASKNPQLQQLLNEGILPTVGQTLGGRWNVAEEKLSSLPVVGDMIANARGAALQQFNKAAINRSVAPIGASVDQVGTDGVRQAGNLLSNAYDNVLGQIKGVNLDPQFSAELNQLQGMAQNLTPDMAQRFQDILGKQVLSRVAPNGGMTAQTYKTIDSDLNGLVSKYGKSSVAQEGELGDALSQLQNLLHANMKRSNPTLAPQLDAIDQGWANLVRVEGAAKSAMNSGGVFTPGQLNSAVASADDSVRKRAVARGTALMQDLSQAGQAVLGNKVPNSFTADRLWAGMGALGGGAAVNPMIPVGVLGAAATYTPWAQNLLRTALARRPDAAKPIADAVRQYAPVTLPAFLALANQQGQ